MKRFPSFFVAIFLAGCPSAPAPAPDDALCSAFASASPADRARLLGEFYRRTSTDVITEPGHHLECLAEQGPKIEPRVVEYCEARAERGHGLIADALWLLSNEIEATIWECEHEAQEPFMARAKAPIHCGEIEGFLRDSLPMLAVTKSPEQIECMRRALPGVASHLRGSCDSDPIPPEVAIRFWDVLVAECPQTPR